MKRLDLNATSEELASVRPQLREYLNQLGLDSKKVDEVALAVDETLSNILRHAYGGKQGKVEVVIEDFDDRVEIRIRDFGKKFDLTQMPPPELPPVKPGGLGIHFIRTVMDKVAYDTACCDGNRLCLTKYKKSKKDS